MSFDLALVKALTLHAHYHQEAAAQTKSAKVSSILHETAKEADEAARLVQDNRLDQLSPKQQQIIKELQS